MRLAIHLLGRPFIDRGPVDTYRFRSRKSWGVLAYLLLSERPPTRSQLASLLFSTADDPLRALRWTLSEIRRALGEGASVEGDPVVLQLPSGTVVDVEVLTKGAWSDAIRLPRLGDDLLDGMILQGVAAFESWLLSEQHHVAAATEAILHEASLAAMSQGQTTEATAYAVRLIELNPYDENHQALLIRLYRIAGDNEAARRQLAACTELFARELDATPGAAIRFAMSDRIAQNDAPADRPSIQARLEAGSAAISAGAIETGIQSLDTAVLLADKADIPDLRVVTRIAMAHALIHSTRGLDEEGLRLLHAASGIAQTNGKMDLLAQCRAELGYVDFLRARYDRAERWLTDAAQLADGEPSTSAKAVSYLGSVESDRGDYAKALVLLEEGVTYSRRCGDVRSEAYAASMIGRVHLLTGGLDAAAENLDESIELAERGRWLAFLPWPQTLRGEVELARGDHGAATPVLEQAFARACQVGDPCWEGISARGLALVEEATGATDRAFDVLADARVRCNRLADPYVWLDAYILDAQCTLGLRHDHPDTELWISSLHDLASRTGMREFVVRALLHGAAIGKEGDAAAARVLAAGIENPMLDQLLASP